MNVIRAYAAVASKMSGGVPSACRMSRSKTDPSTPITALNTKAKVSVVPAARLSRGWSCAP